MTKYGVFDGDGRPTAFYSDDIHGQIGSDGCLIPSDAAEITDADWQLYLSGKYYRDADGLCTEILTEVLLTDVIADRLMVLKSEVCLYIYGVYDAGTQASMQALWSQDATSAAVKTDIEAVWAWIASIMAYYYQCKSAIGALVDVESVEAYGWDFTQFDATCPDVTLQAIFGVL